MLRRGKQVGVIGRLRRHDERVNARRRADWRLRRHQTGRGGRHVPAQRGVHCQRVAVGEVGLHPGGKADGRVRRGSGRGAAEADAEEVGRAVVAECVARAGRGDRARTADAAERKPIGRGNGRAAHRQTPAGRANSEAATRRGKCGGSGEIGYGRGPRAAELRRGAGDDFQVAGVRRAVEGGGGVCQGQRVVTGRVYGEAERIELAAAAQAAWRRGVQNQPPIGCAADADAAGLGVGESVGGGGHGRYRPAAHQHAVLVQTGRSHCEIVEGEAVLGDGRPVMAGRADNADLAGGQVGGHGLAGEGGGLGDEDGRFRLRDGRILRQHKQRLLQRRVRLRDNRRPQGIARRHTALTPFHVRFLNACLFRFFAPLRRRRFGRAHHRADVLAAQRHLAEEANPKAHGVAEETGRKAADEAADLFRELSQNGIFPGHKMLAVFHRVDYFQRLGVDLQPADGRFGRAGQCHHRRRDEDVEVGVVGERRGDARLGLIRDGQGGQFVQRAKGDALQRYVIRSGLIKDRAHADQRRGRQFLQHFMLDAHVQQGAPEQKRRRTHIGLAGVGDGANLVAQQIEADAVRLLLVVALPTDGEQARRIGVGLHQKGVGGVLVGLVGGGGKFEQVQPLA